MNRERWLLLISIFIFVGLGIYYLSPTAVAPLFKMKSPSGETEQLVRQSLMEGATAQKLSEVSGPDQVVDESTPWGRNPFLTEKEEARGREPEVEGLKIKAIIVGPPRSVATLDGRAVLVGEMIGGGDGFRYPSECCGLRERRPKEGDQDKRAFCIDSN